MKEVERKCPRLIYIFIICCETKYLLRLLSFHFQIITAEISFIVDKSILQLCPTCRKLALQLAGSSCGMIVQGASKAVAWVLWNDVCIGIQKKIDPFAGCGNISRCNLCSFLLRFSTFWSSLFVNKSRICFCGYF